MSRQDFLSPPADDARSGRRLLILGACGFIGKRMYERLSPSKAIGTFFRLPFPGGIYFDATRQDLADIVAPDKIWHCMVLYADSMPDSCFAYPAKSNALNIDSTKAIIDRLVGWNIPFTFMSSESVFDGIDGNYTEESVPQPTMLYGKQKLAIEKYLTNHQRDARWTIMRLGKVFGSSAENEKLFVGWIQAIERGEKIRIATDQTFSPIYIDDVIDACLHAASQPTYGLYNLCGTRAYARHELLDMVIASVRRYRKIEPVIEYCSIDDFPLREKRPKNVSMRPDKLIKATGLGITSTEDVCRMIVDDYFREKPALRS